MTPIITAPKVGAVMRALRPFKGHFAKILLLSTMGLNSISCSAHAELCTSWSQPQTLGSLDKRVLPEASGLAISRRYPNRLYHVSDGNVASIVQTRANGETENEFFLEDFKATDIEDLSLGPCQSSTCIFIADIGDNREERKHVRVGWIREKESFSSNETVDGSIKLKYPDGPHNAEAMFIHPITGELFIVTKSSANSKGKSGDAGAKPARVYSLTAQTLMSKNDQSAMLEFRGELDLAHLLPGRKSVHQVATGAAVSDDGHRFLILTYADVLEFSWDFHGSIKPAHQMVASVDFVTTRFDYLEQQEAIAYAPGSHSFVATTESKKKNAEILGVVCESQP